VKAEDVVPLSWDCSPVANEADKVVLELELELELAGAVRSATRRLISVEALAEPMLLLASSLVVVGDDTGWLEECDGVAVATLTPRASDEALEAVDAAGWPCWAGKDDS
jgi:hypothetical protein